MLSLRNIVALYLLIIVASAFDPESWSAEEAVVDEYLQGLAAADIVSGAWNPRVNFDYATLQRLSGSELYRLIDEMPKGAMLHCHRSACFNYSRVVSQMAERNADYQEEYGVQVYVFQNESLVAGTDKLYRSAEALCPAEAAQYGATPLQEIDHDSLIGYWSLENLDMRIMTEEEIWDEFELRFDLPKLAFRWSPVYQDLVIPETIAEMVRHGVSYVEPTGSLGKIFTKTCDDNGEQATYNRYTDVEEVGFWDEQVGASSSGVSVNLLCSAFRGAVADDPVGELTKCMNVWKATRNNTHVRVVGFDIVGREDRFGLARDMTAAWELAEAEGFPVGPHAGETIYPDGYPTYYLPTSPADNLRVHLQYNNTVRIGHGIALANMEEALKAQYVAHGITVVTTPVSNQLLGYVQSQPFHQACELHAFGIKVALSPDDPPIFSRLHSISHDFAYAFRSCRICGKGLKMLKEMIVNGWNAVMLPDEKIQTYINTWSEAWNEWVSVLAQQLCASDSAPNACTTGMAEPAACAEFPPITCSTMKDYYKDQQCCGKPSKEVPRPAWAI